ncbi:MAG: hypothetical protein ACM336_14525 [Acidobacteriota bacterium]
MLFASAVPAAQEHVVAPDELRESLRSAAAARQRNIARIESALTAAHADPARTRQAVAMLSDAELARIAALSEKAQNDFAAGSLTSLQVTMIIVAAILIALIVAIKAI